MTIYSKKAILFYKKIASHKIWQFDMLTAMVSKQKPLYLLTTERLLCVEPW